MLEIAYNFKISSDFFELAIFGANYGFQRADKAITGCKKGFLRHFGPFLAKCRFKMIDTLVFFSENLTLQYAPSAKVQRIKIRRFWWPLCFRNEERNFLFKPFLVDACCVRGGAESCWNAYGLRPKCFSCPGLQYCL